MRYEGPAIVITLPYTTIGSTQLILSYSDEFKYRPAASPVITEHLKDGRIRLRGASIGGIGVREEDIPLTPAQIKARDEQRRKEAREKAKERLGLVGKKRGKGAKGKGKGKGEGRVEI